MHKWLKHKYGYLNIDDENIYATKTGNWSEINGLKEKNYKPRQMANFRNRLKIGAYLIIMVGLFLFVLFSNILSGNISFLLLVGLPTLGYTAFQYIIPEYGSSFVIPKHKITKIRFEESDAYIEFVDANNISTTNRFRKLDQKGMEILKSMNHSVELY